MWRSDLLTLSILPVMPLIMVEVYDCMIIKWVCSNTNSVLIGKAYVPLSIGLLRCCIVKTSILAFLVCQHLQAR